MNTSDFDYDLPPEYIAQTPIEPRDAARLLVLDRKTGRLEHAHFRDLGQFLRSGDLLVLNETRVLPARLYARKIPGGGRVEILLLRRHDAQTWEAWVGGHGLIAGRHLQVEAGPAGEIVAVLDGARRLLHFAEPLEEYLPSAGHTPLPPYIHTPLANPERYQTVYARRSGSAAAPTAGLHFTPQLIQSLQEQGIGFATVTLHVGLDTFAPVTESNPREHIIHTEWCQLTPRTAETINRTRQAGGRIIAVGTTSVRTLESAARGGGGAGEQGGGGARGQESGRAEEQGSRGAREQESGEAEGRVILPYEGATDLFILPGYTFHAVDALITNFHLPRSTLIMLVSAFVGRERILHTYEAAKREGYRFYSFGDAMFIVER